MNQDPVYASVATYNISTATVVKAASGRILKVSVITAAATVSTINDCATTGAAAIGNQILSIPATVTAGTIFTLDWPCLAGICITPGAGNVLAVSYADC